MEWTLLNTVLNFSTGSNYSDAFQWKPLSLLMGSGHFLHLAIVRHLIHVAPRSFPPSNQFKIDYTNLRQIWSSRQAADEMLNKHAGLPAVAFKYYKYAHLSSWSYPKGNGWNILRIDALTIWDVSCVFSIDLQFVTVKTVLIEAVVFSCCHWFLWRSTEAGHLPVIDHGFLWWGSLAGWRAEGGGLGWQL